MKNLSDSSRRTSLNLYLLFPFPFFISFFHFSYILNKDPTKGLNFQYPIFLTTFHMAFATVGTRLLARFTHLLDGLKDVEMTNERWYRNILPIGVLFSASLIFSNMAYLTLSVSFIQMLKVSSEEFSLKKHSIRAFSFDQKQRCF